MRRELVALVICAGCAAGSPARTQTAAPDGMVANATMVEAVDGDTVDVEVLGTSERIRLIGVDTPETKRPDTPVECFGPEASAHTAELLPPGTPLRLERDVQARDDYGRLLAYVYRLPDGLMVNVDLMANGYARPLTIPPNIAYADTFAAAASEARRAGRGLWQACAGQG